MLHKAIGRHVAKLANSLNRTQGVLVAAGFLSGCGIWLLSWIIDWHGTQSAQSLLKAQIPPSISGEWLRETLASKLIDFSSLLAIILAYLRITGRHFDQFVARFWLSEHVIICGLSARSEILAEDLAKAGQAVLIIDLNPQDAVLGKQRQNGIHVIGGDAREAEVLFGAGIKRAKRVICLTQGDEINFSIVERIRSMISGADFIPKDGFEVHCHVASLRLREQLAGMELFVQGQLNQDGKVVGRFRQFSIDHCAAGELLRLFPPERGIPRERQRDATHILLTGSGAVVESLLLHIAKVCHYWSVNPVEGVLPSVQVTLFSPDGAAIRERMCSIYSGLEIWINLEVVSESLEQPAAQRLLEERLKECPVSQCFIVDQTPLSTISKALHLLERFNSLLSGKGVVVAVIPPHNEPFELSEWNNDPRLKAFDLYSACKADSVVGETTDRLAIDIHNAYFNSQRTKDFIEGPLSDGTAMHPWQNLNEWYRNSNRSQVAHIDVKLRALGYEMVKLEELGRGAEFQVTPDELESLGEMEHRRWMAFHLLGGWQYGVHRDNKRKIHPSLKPYAELLESEKQKDRETILGLPRQLESIGYGIRPIQSTRH